MDGAWILDASTELVVKCNSYFTARQKFVQKMFSTLDHFPFPYFTSAWRISSMYQPNFPIGRNTCSTMSQYSPQHQQDNSLKINSFLIS